MSRLGARVCRLEDRLGPCRICADWNTRVELRDASDRGQRASDDDLRLCPACRRIDELVVVYLAYDPKGGRDEMGHAQEPA